MLKMNFAKFGTRSVLNITSATSATSATSVQKAIKSVQTTSPEKLAIAARRLVSVRRKRSACGC
jgi:hypothetical protein